PVTDHATDGPGPRIGGTGPGSARDAAAGGSAPGQLERPRLGERPAHADPIAVCRVEAQSARGNRVREVLEEARVEEQRRGSVVDRENLARSAVDPEDLDRDGPASAYLGPRGSLEQELDSAAGPGGPWHVDVVRRLQGQRLGPQRAQLRDRRAAQLLPVEPQLPREGQRSGPALGVGLLLAALLPLP